MFVLFIINAMMNLKQFGPQVLICVETNWADTYIVDLQWLYLVVGHLCLIYSQVLNNIKIATRNSS